MRFYHLSEDIYNDILEFNPRVPKSILSGEDDKINRVCIAREIKDCINAISYYDSINFLYSSVEDNEVLSGSRLIKVYEFEINEDDGLLKDSFEISRYVPDAIFNREYWYMGSLIPVSSYIINIVDYICDYELSVNCTNVKYELVDIKDIPTKAIIDYNMNMFDLDLDEFLEYINENSNIKGYIKDSELVFMLNNFPMVCENYKNTFKNIFANEDISCRFIKGGLVL